ncbi:hypothetical protein Btru_074085 [Bulinus truncatus]|nr:hypothetical protein Btru_074085 [Bulinus truncatus]
MNKTINLRGCKKSRADDSTFRVERKSRIMLTRESTFLVNESRPKISQPTARKVFAGNPTSTDTLRSDFPAECISKTFSLKKTETPVLSSLIGEGAFRCYSKNNWSKTNETAFKMVTSQSTESKVSNSKENLSGATDSFDISPKKYTFDAIRTFQESLYQGYGKDHDGVLGNIGRHNTKFLTELGQTSSNEFSSNNEDVATSEIPEKFYHASRGNMNMKWIRHVQKPVEQIDVDNGSYFSRKCKPVAIDNKDTLLHVMSTKEDNTNIRKQDKQLVHKKEGQKIKTEKLGQDSKCVSRFETNAFHERVPDFKSRIFQNHRLLDDDSKQPKNTETGARYKTSLCPQDPNQRITHRISLRNSLEDSQHMRREENLELSLDTVQAGERAYESKSMDKGHLPQAQEERLATSKSKQHMQQIVKPDGYIHTAHSSTAQRGKGQFIHENKESGHVSFLSHTVPVHDLPVHDLATQQNQTFRHSHMKQKLGSINCQRERRRNLVGPLIRDDKCPTENPHDIPCDSFKPPKLKYLNYSTHERIVPRTLGAGDSKDVGTDYVESPMSQKVAGDLVNQRQNVWERQCRDNMIMYNREHEYHNNSQLKRDFNHFSHQLSNPVVDGIDCIKTNVNSSVMFNVENRLDPKVSFQGWKVKQHFYTGQAADLNSEKKLTKVNDQDTLNKSKPLGMSSYSVKTGNDSGYRKCRSLSLRHKDTDWHSKDKSKIKKKRCFGHVVKKSKSLISVGHLLSQLTYKPAKMAEEQRNSDDVFIADQWNPVNSDVAKPADHAGYRQPSTDAWEFCDIKKPADIEREKYVKCSKSRKVKSYRHEPYRKQILTSSDSTASPGHQVVRNKNNCSPSRRGRYVTAPQVDPQFFGGENSPKHGHKTADSKAMELNQQMLFTNARDLQFTEELSRSYLEKDRTNISELNESDELQCGLRDKTCDTRQTHGDDWNTNGPFDRGEHQSFEICSKDLVKISETSDTLTRSDTQSSSNFTGNLTNPTYATAKPHATKPYGNNSKPVLSNLWAVGENMLSSISPGDDDSYMSTRDGVSNKMTQAQSMTQSHTTQTDATFLTNSVDVQTSPRLAIGQHQNEINFLMTNAGVQTSPQFDSTSKRGTFHYKRKSFYQSSRISRDRIKSSKCAKSLRNKYSNKSNPICNENNFASDLFLRDLQSNVFSDKSSENREGNLNSTSSLGASGTTGESSASHIHNSEGIHFNISRGERSRGLNEEESTNKDNSEDERDGQSNINSAKISAVVESPKTNRAMTKNTESSFAVNDIFLFKGSTSEQDGFNPSDEKSKNLLKGATTNNILLASNQHVSKTMSIPLPSAIDVTILNQTTGEISETSVASSKLSELNSLCLVRPSWKNANIDEIDRRVKRALRLREELQKQKSMAGYPSLKSPGYPSLKSPTTDEDYDANQRADCSLGETRNNSDSSSKIPQNFTNSRLLKRDPQNNVNQEDLFDKPAEDQTVLITPSIVDHALPEQEHHRDDERSNPDHLPRRAPEGAKKTSAVNAASTFSYERDSSDSEGETVQTKPYSDNIVTSSQASACNIEQNTLKRARAKDKNSPPTKISKVENALTKPVNQAGELVSCLPQVPLASFVEWFIETSDPNSYVSSDHSSNSSGKEREEKVSGNDVNSSVSDDLSCYVHYKGKTTKLSPAPFLDAVSKTPTGAVKFSITTRSADEKTTFGSEFKNLVAMELAAVSSVDTRRPGQQCRDQGRVNEKYTPEGHGYARHADDKMQHPYRQLHVEQHYTRFLTDKKVDAHVTSGWNSSCHGDDALVVSEVSASASGTTVTQLDNCSTVKTPTVQLAYENYSDDVSPSFTAEDETVSSVDTCTAGDPSTFMDECGSLSNKIYSAMVSSSNETRDRPTANNKGKHLSSNDLHYNDVAVIRQDEDKRCPPPARGHILMNIRKANDGHEVGRFDRTRIRLLKSSDLTGIITKMTGTLICPDLTGRSENVPASLEDQGMSRPLWKIRECPGLTERSGNVPASLEDQGMSRLHLKIRECRPHWKIRERPGFT